jgi:hypothetical protein
MAAKYSPTETRAQDSVLVKQCSLDGLRHSLPLPWPAPPDVPPSPKNAYRSHYTYLGWDDLQDPAAWEHLSDFDLLLRLIDFSPLRSILAQRLGWTSARGWTPFDPVSIFLLHGWQITNGWNRTQTLKNLRKPCHADYARRFGFQDGLFPTEGGLRYWLTALGQHSTNGDTILVDEEHHIEVAVQYLNQLIAQSVILILNAGLISPEAWIQALICPDGLIHDAASRMRCSSVTDTCYLPTSPDTPRPCPAKEKGHQGCDCDTLACASICRRATSRDLWARYICYEGSNQPSNDPNDPDPEQHHRGEGHYGYASLPLLLTDPDRRFHLILLDHFSPANARQENPFAAQLLQLATFYPSLHVTNVVGDAAFGYDVVLHTVYAHLHARRVIDLRAHDTDKNKALWPIRGYDDQGRPVCSFGYPFTANGFDFDRQRHKWFCAQTCSRGIDPLVRIPELPTPPDECPYLTTDHPYGRIINIEERFKSDDSIRLVRDVPVGSPSWKRVYHRARNASESRNATFKRWNLKRLPVYGHLRAQALIFLADVWSNLTTLARLIREATAATGAIP